MRDNFFLTKLLESQVCSHIYNTTENSHKVCLLVCLGVFIPFENFSIKWRRQITITIEGLQILTFDRYSWPLSRDCSLACHTNCDMGHPFIMVISEDLWHHTYCRAFSSGAVTTCIFDLGLSRLGFEHLTIRLQGERFIRLRGKYASLRNVYLK